MSACTLERLPQAKTATKIAPELITSGAKGPSAPPLPPTAVGQSLKIVATSDTHGTLPEIPPCDVLIIAGDVCPTYSDHVAAQLQYLDTNFRAWLKFVEAEVIIGIAGNHDYCFEKRAEDVRRLNLPWKYLEDSGISVFGLKIWGSPWVHGICDWWAFHDTDEGIYAKQAFIPNDVDIVVTHGPPHGFQDMSAPKFGAVHAGFPGANTMLKRVKPKALICGHIHEGYGSAEHYSGAVVYNVSHMNENYEPINAPMTIQLDYRVAGEVGHRVPAAAE